MKYIIDLIDDIREAIHNDGTFLMGVVALEKKLNSEGHNTMAWGKTLTNFTLHEDKKQLSFSTSANEPLTIEKFLQESKLFSNEAMMYEVVIDIEGNPNDIVGFSDNKNQRTYMLLIEE